MAIQIQKIVCPHCGAETIQKVDIVLPPIGSRVNWFGTIYTVTGHTDRSDQVIITWPSGDKIPLWWRGTEKVIGGIYHQIPLR